MPNYKEMYHTLFDEITKAIAALQAAQQKAEALYMADESEHPLILLNPKSSKEKQPPQE